MKKLGVACFIFHKKVDVLAMINVFQPSLAQEELTAVKSVFDSNWIGRGKETKAFEDEFAIHLGTLAPVLTISCCSAGLFHSIKLLNLKPGDEVILPSIHFVAAANAILELGAVPVFCDVDLKTLNATAETIEKKITNKTKAVIILHYGGYPCEMDKICDLVKLYNLFLIEDSACSVASRYKDKACGTFGDIGIWSFDAMKILVCGDGGMMYFKDKNLAEKFEKLSYLGLCSQSGFQSSVDKKWWAFDVSCYGRRDIMNDISSSIGREQLKKLPVFIQKRRELSDIYNKELRKETWLSLPPSDSKDFKSSHYFYWLQLPNQDLRDNMAKYLKECGIYTTFRYYPLHWVKYYDMCDCKLPNVEKAAETTLCLPMHQSLTQKEMDHIISSIHNFGKENNL